MTRSILKLYPRKDQEHFRCTSGNHRLYSTWSLSSLNRILSIYPYLSRWAEGAWNRTRAFGI
jgi:hypothetical protein